MFTTMILAVALAGTTPQDPCSANGGFREGTVGATMARMRAISDGSYAACVEARRSGRPATNRQAPQPVTAPRPYQPAELPRAYQPVSAAPAATPVGGIHGQGRQAVLDELISPASATFGAVRAVPHERAMAYCGHVRGLTAESTMTGEVPFMAVVTYAGERVVSFDNTGDPELQARFRSNWSRFCLGGSSVNF